MRSFRYLVIAFVVMGIAWNRGAAQARPTATTSISLSGFGLLSEVNTGFESSKNLSLTTGANISLQPRFGLYPSLELRGTLPLASGNVASQKNIMGGIKLSKFYGPLHPYVNFLAGRAEFRYQTFPVTPDYSSYYVQSTSNIFSPGGGVDFQVSSQLAFKFDAQFGLYSSPVTASGRGVVSSISAGLSYHFSFKDRRNR